MSGAMYKICNTQDNYQDSWFFFLLDNRVEFELFNMGDEFMSHNFPSFSHLDLMNFNHFKMYKS